MFRSDPELLSQIVVARFCVQFHAKLVLGNRVGNPSLAKQQTRVQHACGSARLLLVDQILDNHQGLRAFPLLGVDSGQSQGRFFAAWILRESLAKLGFSLRQATPSRPATRPGVDAKGDSAATAQAPPAGYESSRHQIS